MSRRDRNQQRWSLLIAGLLIVVWVSHPAFGETKEVILSSQEVEAIIPQIEAIEKGIHNLKVDAESWVEERSSLSAPWQRTPTYFSCTAWMDGQPKGKVRVDVHNEVLKWRDGAAPYAGRSYTVSFDGANTKFIEKTAGPSDEQFPTKEGQVSPGASEWIMSNIMGTCIGWRFTTNFFFSGKKDDTSFPQLFRLAITPEAVTAKAFEFEYEEKAGVLCLKFGLRPAKWGRETWWVDPNRGFALMAYLLINKVNDVEHVVSEIRVNKLQEVASGVWWPMEATVESEPRDPNTPYKRTVYRALKVVANDPNFGESVFTPAFPKGYRVDDKVTGKKYVVDANLNMIAEPNK
jgi:hypothetical protein